MVHVRGPESLKKTVLSFHLVGLGDQAQEKSEISRFGGKHLHPLGSSNLTLRCIWEEEVSIEQSSSSDWPADTPAGHFSWLMIDVSGPSPLWAVVPLDMWSGMV